MKLKYERIARAESFGGPTQQRNKKMNEQTAVIGLMMEKLESFASVLGTTAEYLWGSSCCSSVCCRSFKCIDLDFSCNFWSYSL